MILTDEYQYLGRSNAVKSQSGNSTFYVLLYAKTSGNLSTGKHTVTVKQRLACAVRSSFYGYSTSGEIRVDGTTVVSWSRENIPDDVWTGTDLTEDGVAYPVWTDLREGSVIVDVGYGSAKDIQIAATWEMKSSAASYLPEKDVTAAISVTATLPAINGASQPTLSAETVELGRPVTITTNRFDSSFTHALTWQFGNISGDIDSDIGDSTTWIPSISLAEQIPNALFGSATIICTTFQGTMQIGVPRQVPLLLTVPENIVPSCDATYTDASAAETAIGMLVQNVSKLEVEVSADGIYGSAVASVAMVLNGKTYDGGVITESGHMELTVTVRDSRGRIGTKSYPIEVADYTPPKVQVNASRCQEDGTADDTGEYAHISIAGYVTQVNGRNTASLLLKWGYNTETITLTPGEISVERIVAANSNNILAIEATLTDALLSTVRTMTLSTGYATLDLLAGGKGISFGKSATREGFDCAMPAFFTGGQNGLSVSMLSSGVTVSGTVLAVVSNISGWAMYILTVVSAVVTQATRIAGTIEAAFSVGDNGLTISGYGIDGWVIGPKG